MVAERGDQTERSCLKESEKDVREETKTEEKWIGRGEYLPCMGFQQRRTREVKRR